MMKGHFEDQVKLMLDCLTQIFPSNVFALKGGTAINFFFRNMPRLSVDIDLTYLPLDDRQSSHKQHRKGTQSYSGETLSVTLRIPKLF